MFLQKLCFVFKHWNGKLHVVTDVLSKREHILTTIQRKTTCFETLKELYQDDEDFANIWRHV